MNKVPRREVQRRLEHFRSVALRAGVRLTPQRLAIFRAVAASLEHPGAEAVHRAVHARMPTLSLDTVYRTLWLLTDLGILRTLGPRREMVRFEANLDNHHHYVCTVCGDVVDLDCPQLDDLPVPDQAKRTGKVTSTHVEFRGVCDGCSKRTGNGRTKP